METPRCQFCSDLATNVNDPNAFYFSCSNHRELAQLETEKFFKANPDYTKWSKTNK